MIQYIILYTISILIILIYKDNISQIITNLYDGSVCESLTINNLTYLTHQSTYANLCLSKGKGQHIKKEKEKDYQKIQEYYDNINNQINTRIEKFNTIYQNMNNMYNKKQTIDQLCTQLYTSLKKKEDHITLFEEKYNHILSIILVNN